MRLHRATGLGILASREFLATQPSLLSERILRAAVSQPGGSHLHDPAEDAPETAAVIAAAFARAESETDAEFRTGYFRVRCYAVWQRAERILHESGIEWFSPARMNPGCCFD